MSLDVFDEKGKTGNSKLVIYVSLKRNNHAFLRTKPFIYRPVNSNT
jgi:hypothetical protein